MIKKDSHMKKYSITTMFLLVAFSMMAQIKVVPPVLVAPNDAAVNQMPDVLLNWDAVIDAMAYELQLSEDEGFTSVIMDTITSLTAVNSSLLHFSTEYFWRVRTKYEGNINSDWSEPRSFTIFTKFDLFKPNNNANEQMPDVTLQWRDRVGQLEISGVEFFEIQIDTVETFDSEFIINITVNGDVFEKPLANLYFGTTYYWRARAGHSDDVSGWSDVRTFSTLSQIELKKPNNNSVDNDLNVNLRWDDISGLTKYEYQVDDNPEFSSPDVELTENIIEPAKNLLYGTQYFWRLRGRHELDTTQWSEVWNFTTYVAPVLTAPANGDTGIILRPQLRWKQIMGSSKYEINYSKDQTTLGEHVYYKDAFDNELPLLNINTDLEPETVYYWRVRAMSALDTSDYSEVWSFTTIPPVGMDEYFTEAGLVIYPNPAQEIISVQLNSENQSDLIFTLYDLLGQAVVSEKLTFVPGHNHSDVLLNDIANGIYLLKLVKDNNVYTSKLVIRK